MAIYSNPWFIGVVGGIPSGFVVNWITGRVLGKRENRLYLQKVVGANREVVFAIQPGISDGIIPTLPVIDALLRATARRHGLDVHDLYTASQIAEELVKEVMDSSFISSSTKAEYCRMLVLIGSDDSGPEVRRHIDIINTQAYAEYRSRLVSTIATVLGLSTGLITMLFAVIQSVRRFGYRLDYGVDSAFLEKVLPIVAGISAIAFGVVGAVVYTSGKKRREIFFTEGVKIAESDPERTNEKSDSSNEGT